MKNIFSGPLAAWVISMALVVLLVVWYRDCTAPRREAQEIWRDHERVISDIARGKHVNLDEFEDAVRFFERLAKITVPSNHSTFIDAMPTKETAEALGPIHHWYTENQDRIYWDEVRGEVMVEER